MERVLLHCDMNSYFATVEEKYQPRLRAVPFAVCGDPEMRHNIVMAKNKLAAAGGVTTGMSFFQAKELCPGLRYIKADYQKYLKETKLAREIYLKYTDTVIPYGMDEAWIDLTETGASMRDARQIADMIRLEIKYSLGLSASVGVSDNYIFSKLGSDFQKPDATTVISKENFRDIAWPLPASDLLFVGQKIKHKLLSRGIRSIGDIARADPKMLLAMLGRVGLSLWQFANGNDSGFHPEDNTIKSMGNTITPPEDLQSEKDASAILFILAGSVSARLKKHGLKCRCVNVRMKDSKFDTLTRQESISHPTDNADYIFNLALSIFRKHYLWHCPLRSLGIRVDGLTDNGQISFEDDNCKINFDIDMRVRELTKRFGQLNLERSAATKDWT